MIRTVVTGATGRMGAAIVRAVRSNPELSLVAGLVRPGSAAVGRDVGALAGIAPLGLAARDDAARALEETKAQAVIDFTSPKATIELAKLCVERRIPLVVGATGLSAEEKAELERAARKIPLVFAPNMSIGVNVMFSVAALLARVLEGFDAEIVETHHRMKKDAPSGTALRLAEEIQKALPEQRKLRKTRDGLIGERPRDEIGIQTLRGGDVVGEHTVFFFGEGERVELTHRATSRDQFAKGAARAAQWIVGRNAGLYDMQHVLGIKG